MKVAKLKSLYLAAIIQNIYVPVLSAIENITSVMVSEEFWDDSKRYKGQ